jgi:hypothetical protein
MTAVATARRVLSWAAEPTGPPPAGPLWEPARLTDPPAAVRDAAAQLARRQAALLGAGSPPFGGGSQIGLAVVFLAAAAGGRRQARAAALLAQAVPAATARRGQPAGWYDLIARHSLVAAVVQSLDGTGPETAPQATPATETTPEDQGDGAVEPIPELLLAASPLTSVLYRPPLRALRSGATGQAVATAVALLSRPRGQAVLAAGLARWSPLSPVLDWRTDLLTRLRHDRPDLVLDVYLVARTRFAADWDKRIAWAARQLRAPAVADPLAIATLRFWAPLEAVERASVIPLAGLRPLLAGHDQALACVRRFRLDRAGAA